MGVDLGQALLLLLELGRDELDGGLVVLRTVVLGKRHRDRGFPDLFLMKMNLIRKYFVRARNALESEN